MLFLAVNCSVPGNAITLQGLATISSEVLALAEKAKQGKLQPHEFQARFLLRCICVICEFFLFIYCRQGSCTGLEFKASLEKSLSFIKLKMSLNCFGK